MAKSSGMKNVIVILFLLATISVSCDNEEDTLQSDPVKLKSLPGTIYYKWADEGIFKIELPIAKQSLFLKSSVQRNHWDVSWDNQLVLECTDVAGDSDASHFMLSKISDGTIVKQFKYYATDGDIAVGTLSPNGKMIAIHPTFKDGIVITDLDGNVIETMLSIDNVKIEKNPVWMPDNTLLISHKQFLLKTNATFTEVSTIKEFDFEDWGSPTVSKNGRKIAFAASKHIWMMNADGTDMKQITTSSQAETSPAFSPDGNFLLIGTDYHITGLFGSISYLKVIPADGNEYNVDDGEESKGVIPILLLGKSQLEATDGRTVWR